MFFGNDRSSYASDLEWCSRWPPHQIALVCGLKSFLGGLWFSPFKGHCDVLYGQPGCGMSYAVLAGK
jgi:hypothetical protein